ncbi:NHL repeat-containing protein [Ralstonia flaminis]|uniref:Virginiamycin B lyase n=1 Tax=Ralstonia flaminis TaxID=3058597 RepID=A0ABM9K4S2_9RALS|nr:NHL repeat-containing protein [Ralstonia sp. LMG 18101]CAJ0815220.1 Virginiamycin B lyase [Ralstonia sp. LMG 18101]
MKTNTVYRVRLCAAAAISLFLVACGGGDDTPNASAAPQAPATPTTPTYTIGGTIAGLQSGTKLVLLNNGGDALTQSANGAFTFATSVAFNTGYAVSVGTQPLGQSCTVSNGSGTATANITNVAVTCAAAQAQVTALAGSTTKGHADGTGSAASFFGPIGVAVDASGNLYVADSNNNMIRKITPAGVVSTLAGSTTAGHADGTGSAASFYQPIGLAVDASGNVYVADSNNNMIRKITPAGVVSTLAGSTTAGHADGTGAAASFNIPSCVVVDASGNLYVSDAFNNQIRKITPAGVVSTLAGSTTAGHADGTGSAASFSAPRGMAFDASGNLYVADQGNSMIRKITPAGVVSTLAGSTTRGFADGTGSAASFANPSGVAVDASGNVYVADYANNEIRKITPAGVVSTLAGSTTSGSADGTGSAASFNGPYGVAVDAGGNVYVADVFNNMIRKLVPVQ